MNKQGIEEMLNNPQFQMLFDGIVTQANQALAEKAPMGLHNLVKYNRLTQKTSIMGIYKLASTALEHRNALMRNDDSDYGGEEGWTPNSPFLYFVIDQNGKYVPAKK